MPAFSVSKSTSIAVSPETVYEAILDLKSWPVWSPWLISEPDAELVFAHDGKSYSWSGDVVGSGDLEIVSEKPSTEIGCKLRFMKPFKSEADVLFLLKGNEDETEVTWKMDSALPFFLFFMKSMMTTMIGMDYERGLAMLKSTLETGTIPSSIELGTDEVDRINVAGIRTACEIKAVGPSMQKDLKKLHDSISGDEIEPLGPPLSIYHQWAPAKGTCSYTIGVPVAAEAEIPGGLERVTIPATKTFTVKHTGPYRFLGNAWSTGIAHQRARKFIKAPGIAPFEIYENDPSEVDENDLITVVHFPTR